MKTLNAFHPLQTLRRSLLGTKPCLDNPFQSLGESSRLSQVGKRRAVPGLDCACLSNPANDLLDGFFDCLSSPVGEMAFIIGEGTNRSDPGLFVNSLITHYFRAAVFTEPQEPKALADDLNDLVFSDEDAAPSAVSCFYAHYTSSTMMLQYFNAGLQPPLLIRRSLDRVIHLDRGGPAVGSKVAQGYTQGALQLQPGDRLVAFTQGVLKSWSSDTTLTAEASITKVVKHWEHESAIEIANLLIHDAPEAANSSQWDRIVMVASVANEDATENRAFSEELPAAACTA